MTSLEQLLREAMDEHTSSAPVVRTGMAHAALRGSRRTRRLHTAAVGGTSVAVAAIVGTTASLGGSLGSLAATVGGSGRSAAPVAVPSVAAPAPANASVAVRTPVPAVSVPAPVPAVSVPAPVPAVSVPAPLPAVSVPTPVPAVSVSTPVPAVSVPAPVPAVSVPTPVPAVSVPTPLVKGGVGPAALDAVTLPDPAPGFPLRRWTDGGSQPTGGLGVRVDYWTKAFGVGVTPYKVSADGRSKTPTGPEATVLVIDGAPEMAGKVVGHTTVNGQPAVLVDYDNEHGLGFSAGKFSVQVWGSSAVTSDQLVTLAAALRGLPS